MRELIGILCNDLKNRHVTRLREGKCEFRQGFAFNDLLTNLERIAAHCSNVAVAMIETETSEFDTHEYLKSVRHMKDDAYLECFDSYARKYSIPPTKKKRKISSFSSPEISGDFVYHLSDTEYEILSSTKRTGNKRKEEDKI